MKQRSKRRPKPPAIALLIDDKRWKQDAQACRLVRRAASLALEDDKARGGATILLTGDKALARWNARFRGRDRVTNVLSFPSNVPDYLGDIAIAYGVVAKEARAQGKSFAAHAAHLAAHGVLHLLGHDHMAAREAAVMEARERRVLASLGIADPYIDRKAA